MYALRRKDPELHRKWKQHFRKSQNALNDIYQHWQAQGSLNPDLSPEDLKILINLFVTSSNAILQFFETRQLRPSKSSVIAGGVDTVMKMMQSHFR